MPPPSPAGKAPVALPPEIVIPEIDAAMPGFRVNTRIALPPLTVTAPNPAASGLAIFTGFAMTSGPLAAVSVIVSGAGVSIWNLMLLFGATQMLLIALRKVPTVFVSAIEVTTGLDAHGLIT